MTGVVATAFTHWASRADDPQLHDHVVAWNRAKSVSDGKWRTLDSKAIFKQTTTLSELHQGVLSDLLTARLGVGWEARRRRHSAKPRYEIDRRPGDADGRVLTPVRADRRALGEAPRGASPPPTGGQRPASRTCGSTRWRRSPRGPTSTSTASPPSPGSGGSERPGTSPPTISSPSSRRSRTATTCRCCARVTSAMPILADAAEAVVATVAERHSTYGRHNLLAEAHRVLHGVRFASPDDRVAVAERVTEFAVSKSLRLTPPELCHVPEHFRRAGRLLSPPTEDPRRLHDDGDPRSRSAAARGGEAGLRSPGQRRPSLSAAAQRRPAGPGSRAWRRPEARGREDRHVRARRRRARRPGRDGEDDRHGRVCEPSGRRRTDRDRSSGSRLLLPLLRRLSAELGIETENTAKWLVPPAVVTTS